MQPDADLVTRAVGLGTEGVEGGGHALENDQTADVHGHAADRCSREVVGAEVTGYDEGDAEEAVLQEVRGDEGQRVLEEQGQLGAPMDAAAVLDAVAGRGRGRAGGGRAARQQRRTLVGAVVAVHGGSLRYGESIELGWECTDLTSVLFMLRQKTRGGLPRGCKVEPVGPPKILGAGRKARHPRGHWFSGPETVGCGDKPDRVPGLGGLGNGGVPSWRASALWFCWVF